MALTLEDRACKYGAWALGGHTNCVGKDLMAGFARRLKIATWNRGEPARFALLVRLARFLVPSYRFKFPQLEWWQDPQFNAYMARFGEERGQNWDRRWFMHQVLRLVADVPGDTAECGVFRGAGSYLILKANETARTPRHHFMFDSFEGLSAPGQRDGDYWQAGDMSENEATVSTYLQGCRDFTVLKGWIPERFSDVAVRKFAFVHVDVDLYEPTRESLQFFYPRMSDGGIILLDDYGFTTCPGATRAAQEVLSGQAEQVVTLPDGGGLLIKGRPTVPPARL